MTTELIMFIHTVKSFAASKNPSNVRSITIELEPL